MKTVNVPSLPDLMSYFVPPIWNITPELPDPEKPITLNRIYNFIRYDALKSITAEVRGNLDLKKTKLPFITPSICCFHRNEDEVDTYSCIVHLDFDHYNINIRKKIFEDIFLHPAMIFVSPSYQGFKVFIRVKYSTSENHLRYFRSLYSYFLSTYNIKADEGCKDITRACFLCHDPSALFNPFGFVDSAELLKLEPEFPVEPVFNSPPVPAYINPGSPDSNRYGSSISGTLNRLSIIHAHALDSLRNIGWYSSGDKWYKPNKEKKNSHTANWNYYTDKELFLFHVWSDNAPPFLAKKSYTDCQVISLLEYKGNYDHCIHELLLESRVLKVESS